MLYCEAPPGLKQEEFHKFDLETKRIWKAEADQIAEARRLQQQLNGTKVEVIDANVFASMKGAAHVQGNKKIEGRLSDKNKRKKKLRNVYAELDPKRHGHE